MTKRRLPRGLIGDKLTDNIEARSYDWCAPRGAYVDTRGVHPTFVDGCVATSLENVPRDISVNEAWHLVRVMNGK